MLAWITDRAGEGVSFRLHDLRRVGPRVLLHVGMDPGGQEVHQMLSLDAAGRITVLLDYQDSAAAERDLAAPAAGSAGSACSTSEPPVRSS